jgi:hypothetical protein
VGWVLFLSTHRGCPNGAKITHSRDIKEYIIVTKSVYNRYKIIGQK